MDLCLKILNADMKTMAVSKGTDEVNLVYSQEYRPEDRIILETSKEGIFIWLQVDDALGKSLVYVTGNITYMVPFGEKSINISPKAFWGNKHLLCACVAQEYEVAAYRNLVLNVCDQHHMKNCYPHATANVETRGESVFAAQNAIDGITVNDCHGEWPYQSWGINMQEDACLQVDFGRSVTVDCIALYLRADFPHDNWWEQVQFSFSDGSSLTGSLKKTGCRQEIHFDERTVTWIKLHDMAKAEGGSPFPALTQIEVYGRENTKNGRCCGNKKE